MPTGIQVATRRSNTSTRQTKSSIAPVTPFLMMPADRTTAGCALSLQTVWVMPGRRVASNPGVYFRAMRTIDRCSVASIRTNTAGGPLTRVTTSSSTNASRLSATSPSVTVVPLRLVRRGMSSNSSPKRRLETVCRMNPRLPRAALRAKVERSPPHNDGDLAKGQVVAAQLVVARLDGDLAIPPAPQFHLRNGRQLQQVAAQALRRAAVRSRQRPRRIPPGS